MIPGTQHEMDKIRGKVPVISSATKPDCAKQCEAGPRKRNA